MKKKFKHTKTRVKRKTLIRKLDSEFSKYIRQKYAEKNGQVYCFTCTHKAHWKEMQNGHYISRACLILRWNEQNCRPQCAGCNIFRSGKPVDFRENLVKEIGEEEVKTLEASRFKIFKVDIDWFEERLAHYTELLKGLG